MEEKTSNFLFDIIEKDLAEGKVDKIRTRFPPEPNGYLHIGHTKAIYINFTAAKRYGGSFNLRYDDTNPEKEDTEYVNSIYEDMVWLIGRKPDNVFYGSDYFDKCYEFAIKLIKEGKAYVCNLSSEEVEAYRGTLTEPGKESPYRNRTVEENLELFDKMKNGEFPEGYCTLRAKIDMSSPNINLRDPIIYRILYRDHHRQGSKWCIYPLYDWVTENIGFEKPPRQYEFAKLYITNTVMSKRNLRRLVEEGIVDGWDDPRMPTISGLRRRGYTPEALFDFVERAGIAKTYSIVDLALLEHCIREELNQTARRRIAVLEPVKLTLENYPEGKKEYFPLTNNPNDGNAGTREVAFSKHLYIERSDVSLNPPPKYFRLKPDGEVRLMGAYIVKFKEAILDENGEISEIIVTADLESGSGNPVDGRKVKGTVHWVSAEDCETFAARVYQPLFNIENTRAVPEGKTIDDFFNPESIRVYDNCKVEKALADALPGERFQFVRTGYFCKDTKDNAFNQIVELKDSKPF